MYLLEKASNKLAESIASEMKYDKDKQEVIAYGAYAIMQIALSIILVAVFGLLFGVLAEALVISVSGALLRRYIGGAHAGSPNICLVVGTAVCIGFALLAGLPALHRIWPVTGFALLVFGVSFWLIGRLAPVASANKPISEKRRPAMKRGGLILTGVYALACAGLITASALTGNLGMLRFVIGMALSVLWQVFTITKPGEITLGTLDRALSFKKRT